MNLAVSKLLFTFLYEYDGNELLEPRKLAANRDGSPALSFLTA
jgi:hypothetical protein